MDVRDRESKKTVLAELLGQGMVLVTLDARCNGVQVPPHLRDDAQLRLNLSYRFGLPMQLDDTGVNATLTFAGTPYPCSLPWSAIYLLVSHVSGRPILFPADVPPEFAHGMLNRKAAASAGDSHSSPRGRPRLRVVTKSANPEPVASEETEPRPPPSRGHLRVVK
jgi:stringent starvation protein B